MIISKRMQDGTSKPDEHEDEHKPELMKACEDLISAVHSKDASKVADAIKYAIECVEGDHAVNEKQE